MRRLATVTASASSATATSTTPLALWTAIGPISSGANVPSPPPSTMAGPPMPIEELAVAITTSQHPSRDAFPAKQRPEAMPTIGTNPLSRAKR